VGLQETALIERGSDGRGFTVGEKREGGAISSGKQKGLRPWVSEDDVGLVGGGKPRNILSAAADHKGSGGPYVK